MNDRFDTELEMRIYHHGLFSKSQNQCSTTERERERERIQGERDLPHMWIDCVILVFPGHGSIDALTIDMEPTSQLIQSLFIYGLDCAVWCWSNINQGIASIT